MTKHDPAEIEAVADQIQSAYAFITGAEIEPRRPQDMWEAIASAALGLLNAHRAPAIRAAVDNYRANVEANVQWGPGENGILQRAEDSSYRELLAICGIDEQENA